MRRTGLGEGRHQFQNTFRDSDHGQIVYNPKLGGTEQNKEIGAVPWRCAVQPLLASRPRVRNSTFTTLPRQSYY